MVERGGPFDGLRQKPRWSIRGTGNSWVLGRIGRNGWRLPGPRIREKCAGRPPTAGVRLGMKSSSRRWSERSKGR